MLRLFDFPFGPLVLQVLVGLIGAGVVLAAWRSGRRVAVHVAVLVAGVVGSFLVDFLGLTFAVPRLAQPTDTDTILHGLLLASLIGAAAVAWLAAFLFAARS